MNRFQNSWLGHHFTSSSHWGMSNVYHQLHGRWWIRATWNTRKQLHPVGGALSSDWSGNIFITVLYGEIVFSHALDRKFWLNIKKIFINNHYKTIYVAIRTECSSCRVNCKCLKIAFTKGLQIWNSLSFTTKSKYCRSSNKNSSLHQKSCHFYLTPKVSNENQLWRKLLA